MSQPIVNNFFYFIKNKKEQGKIKKFKTSSIRKLIPLLNVQANTRNTKNLSNLFLVRLRDSRWKGTKISTLIFEAKFYLVGSKIILVALHSMLLQTDDSLFPPLE